MALSISDVNSACDRIHSLVQMSGLHFLINQTPWSSYITIQRKFVNPGAYNVKTKPAESAIIDQPKERTKKLELKVAELEYHLEELEEESKSEKENHEKNVEHFNNRISTLEKETKIKDVMIQNINAHLNMKVADLSTKEEELKAVKKESIEKKALKKQRQKILKQANKSNVEPVDKDLNENLLLVRDLSVNSEPSLPVLHNTPSIQCSPEQKVPPTPSPRRCSPGRRSPATAPSPHTPPGLPPPPSELLCGPSQALLGYFVNAAPDLAHGLTETAKPFITTEYIKNISKLSLVPRKKENGSSW